MGKNIMIQGTMSNAGKSLLAAGLCRVLRQDGYTVAPFKSQNMALNSFITASGGEMGRAQVVQAEAAGIAPDVRMNPILLKPTTDMGSQVIVNGRPVGNMNAMEYYRRKAEFVPAVLEAYRSLESAYDVVVIEGAGSPAEINLKREDIVNMGLARLVDAPVLLMGDIDRGGVFAQLYGTVALLEEDERARIKGVVVNKFRGDRAILEPGLKTLEELCGVPVAGVVPYLDVDIDDEDSLSARLDRSGGHRLIDIAVIRLPRISNFTDFAPFERYENVSVRYVDRVGDLHQPDLVLLPGTKSTIADLRWLRQSGLEAAVQRAASAGVPVMGICGGYQMLGRSVADPEGAEAEPGTEIAGMGLLEVDTVFSGEKVQRQTKGVFGSVEGPLRALSGLAYQGYEIHMGRAEGALPVLMQNGNVYGTYLHGVFDAPGAADAVLKALCARRGVDFARLGAFDAGAYRERQYDILAQAVRESLDMDLVYRILEKK
ncbi:MAG: cobyric acid synthase [Oscillospiraceae bacterium]|jgi:adenosylcobyric acid synthase|nr:cobyric acid synthase [Oscillospiraceae bacterium]